jgi:hypothetical protein
MIEMMKENLALIQESLHWARQLIWKMLRKNNLLRSVLETNSVKRITSGQLPTLKRQSKAYNCSNSNLLKSLRSRKKSLQHQKRNNSQRMSKLSLKMKSRVLLISHLGLPSPKQKWTPSSLKRRKKRRLLLSKK